MRHTTPLVSVICLCYNHGRFVADCLESVYTQSYPNIELIIVDDASKDDSAGRIHALMRSGDYFIQNCENLGICRSFNLGLARARGKYIVDLACDDILPQHSIASQVAILEQSSLQTGAVFGDAILIEENGRPIGTWYERDDEGRLLQQVPSGDVFRNVLAETPILMGTSMTRKAVFDELDGYDEELVYEDFDFLVRATRNWHYLFVDQPWMIYRQVAGSDSKQQLKKRTAHLESTWKVCRKAAALVRTEEEKAALVARLRNCLKQCFLLDYFELAEPFAALHREFRPLNIVSALILAACKLRIPGNWLYRLYLKGKS